LSAILLVLAGCSARLAKPAFDALALLLALCAAVLVLLVFKGRRRRDL